MISVVAPGYVPFEPRTEQQRSTRSKLREALAGLRADPGEVLRATFAGALPAGADLENALFYNLAAAGVFDAMRGGVSFEVAPPTPLGGVRYEYAIAVPDSGFEHWRTERSLAAFDARLGATPPTLASIWWALRSARGAIRVDDRPRLSTEAFTMSVNVAGAARGLTPGLLKTVLDGTICGLQSEDDATQATVVAPAIATGLGAPATAVLRALVDDAPSALGSRTRLVHPHGRGVKWEPDDDRLVAALVTFATADAWRIDGTIATAAPVP